MTHRSRSGRGARTERLASALALFVVCAALPARADLGDGIEVGAGRLKLGIDLSLRYDSEAAAGVYSGSNVVNPADLIVLGGGRFQLDVKNDTTLVDFGGALNWNQYTGLFANTLGLSFLGAQANGEFDFNVNRPVGVDITENFSRSDQNTNPVFGLGVLALTDLTRLRLRFRPGGGALEFGVGAEFDAAVYNSQLSLPPNTSVAACDSDPAACPAAAGAFDSLAFYGKVDGSWRFLPKTGLMLELLYGTFQYLSTSDGNVNAQPLMANVGFGTLLTTRLTFNVKIGYDGIFFADGVPLHNDFDGQLEFGYHFTDTLFGRIGAGQLVSPVAGIDHYYDDDRAYLELGWKALPVLSFSILGGFDEYRFGSGRIDQAYGAQFQMDWSAMHWLHVLAGFMYTQRTSTDDGVAIEVGAGTTPFEYQRYIASMGLSFLF